MNAVTGRKGKGKMENIFGGNANQSSESSDVFDDIEGAQARQSGVYPVAGVYPVLFVDVLKMIKSRQDDTIFIAEFDIVKSEVEARPAGTRMSWAVNFRHDAAPGNVKAFLAALMNVEPEKIDKDGAKMAVSSKNPCHGRLIRLEASMTKTKRGNDFTICDWRPIPEPMQEKATDLREEAGFAPF